MISFTKDGQKCSLSFARDGSISIRDQLATQLMLAIASGELGPGKRLPSTRALAKRFRQTRIQ